MKIRIDHTIPDLTPEEIADEEAKARNIEDDPEKVKADLLQCNEVVFSPQVLKQLEEMGITPDDLVAMMLKKVGASQ